MKAHCNGAEEAAETPRDTNSGPSAGRAFALWIALSGPLEGLYRAIFASNAKKSFFVDLHSARWKSTNACGRPVADDDGGT